MVAVGYQIGPARSHEYSKSMKQICRIKRRDVAFMGELFIDIEGSKRFVECFMIESWLEHLRQHERITVLDRDVGEKVRATYFGTGSPKVTHLVVG